MIDAFFLCVYNKNMEKYFMGFAIKEAAKAAKQDEVPVGAVVVYENKIIAKAYNKRQKNNNSVAHAEILALQKACKKIGNWRLLDCDLYVTLEPCPMCAGAAINSRIRNIYFGAYDSKGGCCGTLYNLPTDKRFNHTCGVFGGVLEEDCAKLLSNFFLAKRQKSL